MLLLYTLLFVSATSLFLDVSNERVLLSKWNAYKNKHKLDFGMDEDEIRKDIFKKNVMFINEHNQKGSTYTMGITQFTHMTHEEYLSTLKGGFSYSSTLLKDKQSQQEKFTEFADVDWRTKGAVTPVKDQMGCMSCWSFSATGSLEGQYFLKNGTLVSLSEKDLIDCSVEYGNHGCRGGLMHKAFDYVMDSGINTEKDYPYVPEDGECLHDDSRALFKLKGYEFFEDQNETHLSYLISTVGPISIGFDATGFGFQFYKKGVYTSDYCSSTDLNHGMTLVGIGSKPSPHYIIKNSWNDSWGNKGYILSARNSNNMCGIATYYTYPIIQ